LPANSPATDNLAHHRVTRQTLSIVDILIPCKTPKHRLAQKTHQAVDAILTLTGVLKKRNRFIEKAQGFIKLLHQAPGTAAGRHQN
jgi:hypothetical protein